MRPYTFAAFLSVLFSSTLPSQAENATSVETALWKSVGNWSVYIDKTVSYQCFITILYDDYTVFRVGFQDPKSTSALYVAIGNLNWSSIEDGKDYDLVLQLDNESGWKSPATGMHFGTFPSLIVNTNQTGFVDELMRKHSLRVFFNDRQILNLSLRGSNAALQEMAACQNAVDGYLGRNAQPSDPFSGVSTPKSPKDPFATY